MAARLAARRLNCRAGRSTRNHDSAARADSIPGLEIEADDVRCTHGATAAQVEEEYLFYLMARGLSRAQAERMIVQGFFQAVLDRVPVESVVHKLERVIERKIGG